MAITNIRSSDVTVYPTSSRDDKIDPKARFNTEKNLTSFVNRLTGIKSFIVEGIIDSSNTSDDNILTSGTLKIGTLNIGGYIFYLNSVTSLPSASSSDKVLYFETEFTDSDTDSLLGDKDGYYKGLVLKTSSDTGIVTSNTKLVIARKNADSNWVVEHKAFTPILSSNINIQGDTNTSQSVDSALDDYLLRTMIIDDGVLS